MSEILIDSYGTEHQSGYLTLDDDYWGNGQALPPANRDEDYKISRARFYLKRAGAGAGNVVARIYVTSGASGKKIPTGGVLAESDAVAHADISAVDFELVEFTFSGANQIVLDSGTWYGVTIWWDVGNANTLQVGDDTSSPTHGGNAFYYDDGAQPPQWVNRSSADVIFYLYGYELKGSANLGAGFEVGQGREEIPAGFEVGQGWENLPCGFIARHAGSVELKAGFDGQATLNLPGEFIVRQIGSVDLRTPMWVNQASTVGTSAAAGHDPIRLPLQRAAFYAQGRRWVFYTDGTNLVFSSSTDGISWAAATNVRACTEGKFFSIHFDGVYVHYAYANGVAAASLYYRRGTPQSNGTINWSAAEQEAMEAGEATEQFHEPSVTVEDSGYPVISFKHWYEDNWRIYAVRSDNDDGTWSGSEFPKNLESAEATTRHMILPLTEGKLYCLIAGTDGDITGRLYTGDPGSSFDHNWESAEDTGADIANSDCFDAVSFLDHVHLVWTEKTTFKIQHRKRTYGVGWSASHTIHDAVLADIGPSLGRGTEEGIPSLYVFWAPDEAQPTADHVLYKTSTDDGVSWTGPVDWIDDSADTFPLPNQQSAFYMQGELLIGCVWVRSSPDDVRYGELDAPGNSSLDLGAGFLVKQWRESLLAGFIVRRSASVDLKAGFDGQAIRSLSAGLIVRHESSRDLGAELISRHADYADLRGEFISRHEASVDAPKGIFEIRRSASQEFPGEFIVRHEASQDLLGGFIARGYDSRDLLCGFIVRHAGSTNLLCGFIVRHAASVDGPKGLFTARHSGSQDLLGGAVVRHSSSVDLGGAMVVRHSAALSSPRAHFAVRHAWPWWTSRRLINGVVEEPEKLIGDAPLEIIIEGVQDDVQVWLDAEDIDYTGWTDLDTVPKAIKRATTYAAVAALYARRTKTFQARVIPTVSPVTVTVLSEDEKSMRYWEDRSKQMLELYFSAQGATRLWVSTEDEEAIFSMEDIPDAPKYSDGKADVPSWHEFILEQRDP